MSELPICEHRGDLIQITAPNSGAVRDAYECFQIHHRGREDVAHVSAAACGECGYHNEAFDNAPERYQQVDATRPTSDEFADRWMHCAPCPHREANFCLRALGVCSLSQKLGKSDFECPVGNFPKIARE